MKLNDVGAHRAERLASHLLRGIHEKERNLHFPPGALAKRGSGLQIDVARTRFIVNEADVRRAEPDSGVNRFGRREAADFDKWGHNFRIS